MTKTIQHDQDHSHYIGNKMADDSPASVNLIVKSTNIHNFLINYRIATCMQLVSHIANVYLYTIIIWNKASKYVWKILSRWSTQLSTVASI